MLDTEVRGSPERIDAVARYLTGTLAPGVSGLADRVLSQRSTLERGWRGEAGDAFQVSARTLGRSADAVASLVIAMGRQVAALALTLRRTQAGMAALRDQAAGVGLPVVGETIWPPVHEPDPRRFERLSDNYRELSDHRDVLLREWHSALDETAGFLKSHASEVVTVTSSLVVAGCSGVLLARHSSVMAAEAQFKKSEVARVNGQIDELMTEMRSGPWPHGYSRYDELLNGSRKAADEAAAATDAARDPKLPPGLAGGLGLVDVISTGYGVYADVQSGESTEQAVVSQGSGLLAAVATGAAAGSIVGTATTPVVGTVAGALTGSVAAILTDRGVDKIYERGGPQDADPPRSSHSVDDSLLHLVASGVSGTPDAPAEGFPSLLGGSSR